MIAFFSAGRHAELENGARLLLQSYPQFGFLWKALSVALQAQGKDALDALNKAAQYLPADAEAHNNLGVALRSAGRISEAIDSHARALQLNKTYFEGHYNLGLALFDAKRYHEALPSLRCAVALVPHHAEAWNNLGNALRELDQLPLAARCYLHAFAIDPALAEVNSNLGTVLRDLGRLDDAVARFRHALQSNSGMAELHNNLGNALQESGQFADSLSCFRQALIRKPDFTIAHNNLAKVLRDLGDLDGAIRAVRRAMLVEPEYPEARLNHAYFLLQRDDYAAGWREYEYRWKIEKAGPFRQFAQPLWLGESSLSGKTILLHAEQGLGDTLQFVRYLPLVLEQGAKVILEVPDELFALIENSFPHPQLIAVNADQPLPPFDCHCPLLSLPLAFGTMPSTVPGNVPYLRANAMLIEYWRSRLGQARGLRVGLVWAGNPRKYNLGAHIVDSMRSMSWQTMSALLDVPGVEFFSLQVGAEAAAQLRAEPRVTDYSGQLRDFQDTAALAANLDLIISVDTSSAHLAGAIGKPVWMLNRFNTCWRWGSDKDTTVWYPAMRIFRQPSLGDWESVIARVRLALNEFAR